MLLVVDMEAGWAAGHAWFVVWAALGDIHSENQTPEAHWVCRLSSRLCNSHGALGEGGLWPSRVSV
jgi:hypothetical protein